MDYPNAPLISEKHRRPTILEDGPGGDMLNERQVSAEFNIAVKTLQNWRGMKPPRGPAYQKAGRKVLYKRCDIEQWLQRNRVEPK